MAVIRRTSRARYLLLILVLVAVTLITLDARGGAGVIGSFRSRVASVAKPVQQVVHDALAPVGNFLTGAVQYGALRQENQALRRQITSMQTQAVSAHAAQARAAQVFAQAHLSFVGNVPTVAAEVINQGSSNFENTVTLDKGSSSGLAVGQPVVAGGGLVGSIGVVTTTTATVDLLSDPNFVVGIDLGGGVVGSAQGYGTGRAMRVTFDQPPPATTVKGHTTPFSMTKGQAVVTSGLPLEKFPANIPVAKVTSFSFPKTAPAPTVTLAPLVNLSRLDFVRVELWSPQTAP